MFKKSKKQEPASPPKFAIGIDKENAKVVLDLGHATRFVGLDADSAMRVALAMIEKARELQNLSSVS